MLNYSFLETLDAIARQGSFQRAATALGLTQPAITQRLKALEENVGQPLVIRGSPPRLTPMGKQLMLHFQQVRALEQGIFPAAHGAAGPQPVPLPIALNTESLATWFFEAVSPWLARTAALLHLRIADQEETPRLLKEGEVLGCITSLAQAPPGCLSRRLGRMTYRCVASPAFASRYFSEGLSAEAAAKAPAAIYDETDRLHETFLATRLKKPKLSPPPYFYVPSPEGLVRLVETGVAYAILPAYFVDARLTKKQLVDLFPEKPYRMPLYWHTTDSPVALLKELGTVLAASGTAYLLRT